VIARPDRQESQQDVQLALVGSMASDDRRLENSLPNRRSRTPRGADEDITSSKLQQRRRDPRVNELKSLADVVVRSRRAGPG